MSTETENETVMQAWFGSPKKIAITIAGFLSIGLVGFTFIGGNTSSNADAQQSSSRVDVATAASGHEAILGKWSWEGCHEGYTIFRENSAEGFGVSGKIQYTASYSGTYPEITVTKTKDDTTGVVTYRFINEDRIKAVYSEVNGKEYSTARYQPLLRCG